MSKDDGKEKDSHGDENHKVTEIEETKGMDALRLEEGHGGGELPISSENDMTLLGAKISPGSTSTKAGRKFSKTEARPEKKHPRKQQKASAGSIPRHSVSNAEKSSTPNRKVSLVQPISGSPGEMSTKQMERKEGQERQTVVEMMQLQDSKKSEDTEEDEHTSEMRKHSSSNLVSIRRGFSRRQASLELIEDDTSNSSDSDSGSRESEKIAEQPDKPTAPSPHNLNYSRDMISGMAAAAKATVKRNAITSKYLKLFSPSNSVSFVYVAINGTVSWHQSQ